MYVIDGTWVLEVKDYLRPLKTIRRLVRVANMEHGASKRANARAEESAERYARASSQIGRDTRMLREAQERLASYEKFFGPLPVTAEGDTDV